MARTQNTITGRMSGSIGGIRFSTWKGLNVAASKPETVANPKSLAQRSQRAKMRSLVSLYRNCSDVLNVGYQQQAVHMSGFNAFVSENIKNGFLTASGEDLTFDLNAFVASKGTLTPTPLTGATWSAQGAEVVLAWSIIPTGDQDATDIPFAVIIDQFGNASAHTDITKTRASAGFKFTPPSTVDHSGSPMVYVFFYQKFSRKVSNAFINAL